MVEINCLFARGERRRMARGIIIEMVYAIAATAGEEGPLNVFHQLIG